jgi:hypothetical protein
MNMRSGCRLVILAFNSGYLYTFIKSSNTFVGSFVKPEIVAHRRSKHIGDYGGLCIYAEILSIQELTTRLPKAV